MTRKFWMLAAAALTLGLAQSVATAQSGPPTSGDSSAVFFIPGTVNLVAGLNGTGTQGDPTTWGDGGLATAAKLNAPIGIAFDSKGNLYITDSGNDDVRKIDSTTGDISLFAGTGSFGDTAPATNAQATTVALGAVTGLAIDSSDNVYFADRQNNVVWKVDTSGVITIFAGTIGTSGYTGDTGLATSATLYSPYSLAFDISGNLYIADTGNNVIRVIGTNGKINTFAGNGTGAGQYDACPANIPALGPPAPAATAVGLCDPYGVAVDASGNVYVSSYTYDQVYKVGTNGDISLFAGSGANYGTQNCCESGDGGQAGSAELWRPFGLYADPTGNVYIVDQFGSFVREVNTSGVINKVYGDGSGDILKSVLGTPDIVQETANVGDANGVYFITMDADGNLVVPSTGVVLSAGSTGNYFFGYNNYLYTTATSTSLNTVSPAFPPYITLSNPSGVTLTFTGMPTITGPFAIAGGTCTFPGSVAPGDSCTVIPSFTPTVDGAATGSIVIPSNANDVSQSITQNTTPLTITLEGSGVGSAPAPVFTLLPSSLTFTSPTGVQSAAQLLTLKNTGQVPFTIFSFGIENSTNFAVSAETCPSAGSATNIAVGASCTFNVTFTPSSPTTFAAGLQVCVSSASYSDYCNSAVSGNSVNLSGSGTGSVSFGSPALDFGGVVVGQTSAALSATLTNGGADGLNIQSISITGANPSDYAIATGTNACVIGNVLTGGGLSTSTCNIYVTFTPGSAASLAATLQVTLQDPNTSPATTLTEQESLTGTGVVFSSNVGTAQAAQAVTVNFATAGTVSSIQVLTQGGINLDFTNASGGTCSTTTAYTVGKTCTVNVGFKPEVAGTRNGAIVITDSSGDILASTYLSGTGNGPQIIFGPGVLDNESLSTGAQIGPGIAVDASGNLYLNNTELGTVVQIPWNGTSFGTAVTIANESGFSQAKSIAVDGAGNVYVGTQEANELLFKIPWNGSAWGIPVLVPIKGVSPTTAYGVAVDWLGNIYFADRSGDMLVKVPWTGSGYGTASSLTVSGMVAPIGVAVDGSLNVYVADTNTQTVYKLPWTATGYGTQTTVPLSAVTVLTGIALDGDGDVLVAGTSGGNTATIEVPWNGTGYGTQFVLPGTGSSATVAVDGAGNVYNNSAEGGNLTSSIEKVDLADPPSLTFASTNVGSTSTDSPKTVTIYDIGNVSLYFNATADNPLYPGNFPENSNDTSLCLADDSVREGSSCDISVDFMPTAAGPLAGDIVLTDNNLNGSNATQDIPVSGNGEAAAPSATLTPTLAFPNTTAKSTSSALAATLTNSGGSALNISSVAIGGTNPSDFAITTGTNACGTSLAANASCSIYVTFTPAAAASYSATLTVTDNASPTTQTSALTGTGTAAPVSTASLSPSPYVFTTTTVQEGLQSGFGGAPAITLTNTGNTPITFTGSSPFTITGASNSPFSTYPNGSCTETYVNFSTALPAGASCTITVQFWPQTPGAFEATLSVADSASNSPQTIQIYGIGAEGQLQFYPGQFNIIAGTPGTQGDTGSGGPAASALIGGGNGVVLDNSGNVYLSDSDYNTVWQINTGGDMFVYAGKPSTTGGYGGDNNSSENASLNSPQQLAIDPTGNLYIADQLNNVIRIVPPNTIINTFAGDHAKVAGYGGDGGAATSATLNGPQGVATDSNGNVYIADTGNSVVRMVDATGKITLFAGDATSSTTTQSGYSGDTGNAVGAKLNKPTSVATDLNGNVYIADTGNNVVRIVANGIINTYAGGGSGAVTTQLQAATSVKITVGSLATDPAGDLYISGGNALYAVNTSGQIWQIAGGGTSLTAGIPANTAEMTIGGIAVDSYGDLYIDDPTNHIADEVGPDGDLVFPSTAVNTTSNPLTLLLTNTGNSTLYFSDQEDDDVARANSRTAHAARRNAAHANPLNVVDFNSYGDIFGPFSIASGGNCNFDNGIPAGQSCTMNVTFTPTALGPATGGIELYTQSGDSYDYYNEVLLSGTGTTASAPAVTLNPTPLAFPSTLAGSTSSALTSTLTNSGTGPLTITATAVAGANPGDFTESDTCVSSSPIAVNGTCTITVKFAPTTTGSFSASVSITDNASNSPQSLPLSGTGTAPAVTLNPTSLSFPSTYAGSASSALTSTLTNSGTGPLTITATALAGTNPSDFTESDNCVSSSPIAVNGTCTITVKFAPTATGSFSASLSITDNAFNSPQSLPLSGTGTAAPDFSISATPATQTITAGTTATYTVTVDGINSFNNNVALSLTGYPPGSTVTFSPPQLNPSDGPATSTLTVLTPSGLISRSASPASLWPVATPTLALLLLMPFRRWRNAFRGKLLFLVVALASLATAAALTGCGGGFALPQTQQTYTLTITGTGGSDTHSTTVQLIVQ